ncbi:MAG: hypothetical protein L3J16_06360, partial [Anaerolineales bacterium]|nr:hypothetical protein [Anaerolineales bacterium]
MIKKSGLWIVTLMILASMVLTACGGGASTPEEPAAPAASPTEAPAAPVVTEDGGCPAITITNRGDVAAGEYERLYELADYEAAAGCTMAFSSNPEIADLNARITNNPDLPPVEERVPAEPLVVVPYEEIGQHGGTF